MVGLYLSVWVRKRLARHVRGVQTTSAATGWGGYVGNKGEQGEFTGGVGVSVLLHLHIPFLRDSTSWAPSLCKAAAAKVRASVTKHPSSDGQNASSQLCC